MTLFKFLLPLSLVALAACDVATQTSRNDTGNPSGFVGYQDDNRNIPGGGRYGAR